MHLPIYNTKYIIVNTMPEENEEVWKYIFKDIFKSRHIWCDDGHGDTHWPFEEKQ